MKEPIWMPLAVELRLPLLAVAMGLAAAIIWLTFLEVSSALALEGEGTHPVLLEQPELQQPEPSLIVGVFFTDPAFDIPIMDLMGNEIGEGRHSGKLRCILNYCSQQTQLSFTSTSPLISTAEYEYKFKTWQARDLDERRLVVAGSGTILNGDQKERYLFTATIQDNRDGTLSVRYEASRADASFEIREAPGRLEFRGIP